MEKFSYIVKYVYHTDWLDQCIWEDEEFGEEVGPFFVENGKEYIYHDLKNYQSFIDNNKISFSNFLKNSYIKYTLYRFMKKELIIENYKIVSRYGKLTVTLLNSKTVPYYAFSDGYIYISYAYYENGYKIVSYINDWSTDKERLMKYIKSSNEYKRRDKIVIIRIPVKKFSFSYIGTVSINIARFVFKYIEALSKDRRKYVDYIMRVSEGDICCYDSNLMFLYKRSMYIADSDHTIDDILDDKVYHQIVTIIKSKEYKLYFIEAFSKLI